MSDAIITIAEKITRRKIATISLILTVLVVLNPLLLPIRASPPTQDFYDVLTKELPKGSVIWWGWGGAPYQDYSEGIGTVMKLIFENNHKVVFCTMIEAIGTYINDQRRMHNMYGAKYGEDWVVLPFITGATEMKMARWASGTIADVTKVDFYDNPIDTLPLLQKVKGIRDANIAITIYYDFTEADMYIRQWCIPIGIKMMSQANYATVSAWYGKDKYVIGNINWIRGYAELEYLAKNPGEQIISMDARNLNVFFTFAIIVIGIIAYQLSSRKQAAPTGVGGGQRQ